LQSYWGCYAGGWTLGLGTGTISGNFCFSFSDNPLFNEHFIAGNLRAISLNPSNVRCSLLPIFLAPLPSSRINSEEMREEANLFYLVFEKLSLKIQNLFVFELKVDIYQNDLLLSSSLFEKKHEMGRTTSLLCSEITPILLKKF